MVCQGSNSSQLKVRQAPSMLCYLSDPQLDSLKLSNILQRTQIYSHRAHLGKTAIDSLYKWKQVKMSPLMTVPK